MHLQKKSVWNMKIQKKKLLLIEFIESTTIPEKCKRRMIMYEEIFKNSYEEIVIAGKLIVKLSKLLDEKKENTLEIKKETAETLEFLRSRVIYYRSAYQHEVLERKEMEDYCRNFQSCECGSYCDKKETCNPAE